MIGTVLEEVVAGHVVQQYLVEGLQSREVCYVASPIPRGPQAGEGISFWSQVHYCLESKSLEG